VTADVDGPDPQGRYELQIFGHGGEALVLLRVPAERCAEAEAFAASVRYASYGTSADGAAA
jgi:hypothetical protein